MQRFLAISRLRQHFPEMPSNREELWRRIGVFALIVIATGIAAFVKPFTRTLAMETILSTFAGASVLWWESNSGPDEIELLVRHIKRMGTADRTAAERALFRTWQGFSALLWCAAILMIASYSWLIARPHGLEVARRTEALVVAFAVLCLLAMRGIKVFSDWHMGSVRRDFAAHPASRHDIARRAVRTWGFLLIGLATLLQGYPTWMSFSPSL